MVLDAMTLLAFMAHRDSVDIWQDGNPIDYWIDEYGFRCIRYESGRWWRYHLVGTTWKWFRLKHDKFPYGKPQADEVARGGITVYTLK